MIRGDGQINNTFVCLDDITGQLEEMNYVIYNPSKQHPHERVNYLYEKIKERFNVELTSEQLIWLTKYDTHELNQFVSDLKQIIAEAKK